MRRSGYIVLGGFVGSLLGAAAMSGPAAAVTTRFEAEAVCAGGTNGAATSTGYSFTGGTITCSVTLPAELTTLVAAATGVTQLNMCHSGSTSCAVVTQSGGLFTYNPATKPAAGARTFTLQYWSGSGAGVVDYLDANDATVVTTTTTTTAPTTTTTVPATTTTTAPATTTTTQVPTATTTPPPAAGGYPVTEGDAQIAGLVLGLAAGSIVGGVLFAQTWRDDQP